MPQSSRSIEQLLANFMLPFWVGAVLLLMVVIALAQVPEAEKSEAVRMEQSLQRVYKAVREDVQFLNNFTLDWGMWDDTYRFMAKPNQAYIDANLTNIPIRQYEISVLSFLNLQGEETRTHVRTLLPDSGLDMTQHPNTLNELKRQLVQESRQQGMTSLSGVTNTRWGPVIFSLQPVTNSAGSAPPNGFLLALRWMDKRYMADLAERTALAVTLSPPNGYDNFDAFQPLEKRMRYRLTELGLEYLRGDGLVFDNQGNPVLILSVKDHRDILQGAMKGALWTMVGMLVISLGCIFLARLRLRAIVSAPLGELMVALQTLGEQPDVSQLPVIDSSKEMALLSRKFREMAAKISLHHRALREHSSRMEQAAHTDALTGLFNRRYLDEWLLARYEQSEPRWLVLVDLDHFKQINDRFGHDIGDLVLCQLAELLQRSVSAWEPLIRLGGEEFLLLLSEQEAATRIERLRQEIAVHSFGSEMVPLRVTASLGYCRYPLNKELDDSFWNFSFKLADIALYRAKQEGRNRWGGFSGELDSQWWVLSPEQIAASSLLTYRTSERGGEVSASAPEQRVRG